MREKDGKIGDIYDFIPRRNNLTPPLDSARGALGKERGEEKDGINGIYIRL
jgi:hypothetical protein